MNSILYFVKVLTGNSEDNSMCNGIYCLWAYSFNQKRWFTLSPIPAEETPGMECMQLKTRDLDFILYGIL